MQLSRPDPKWLQLAALTAYAVSARELFFMERSHGFVLGLLVGSCLLDLAIGKLKYGILRVPLSAMIIALAASVLLDARVALPYWTAIVVAVLSKAFIRYRGKHLFNPACFGVVVALQLFPELVTGKPTLFSGTYTPSIIFAIVGVLTVLYAKQYRVSGAWLVGFALFALLRSVVFGTPLMLAYLPALSPAFLLFSFHMISDPATTPQRGWQPYIFGLFVATFDASFRILEIPYGNFYALALVGSLMPWIRSEEHELNIPANTRIA